MKTHSFRGRRYKIVMDRDIHGYCEVGGRGPKELYVSSRLEGTREHLITCLHEAMHAEEPDASEARVDRITKAQGRFLWRAGYRLSRSRQ